MDFQYFLFLFYVVLAFALASSLYMLGKTSAERVWERAKKELDADPTLLVVSVPYVTSVEAILIFAAVMLRSPAQLIKVAYRECWLKAWEKNPAIRQFDGNSPTTTVLESQYSSGVKRWLTSATSKAAGSNEPPIHSLRLSCSGSLESASAARNSS